MTAQSTPFRTSRGLDALALVCLVLIAASLRPAATSLGPVLAEVTDAFDLTAWQSGLLTAFPGLVFAPCGLIALPLLTRAGLFGALTISCACTATGIIARALSDTWPGFATLTVLALIGMALGNVVLLVYVKARFPARGQLAATVFTVSLGLGATLPSLLTAPLTAQAGTWRVGLGFWAVIPVTALVAWLVLRAAGSVPRLAGPPAPEAGGTRVRKRIVASPKARWMALFFGFQSVNAYVQFGWLPQIYRDGGLDAVTAGIMIGIVAFSGIPGGFLAPQIIVRDIYPRAFIISFAAASTAGYTGLLISPAAAPVLWAVLLAYGGFAFPAVLALITRRTTDVTVTASTSAFVQSSGYILAAVCPMIVGALLGLTGGWTAPIVFMIGISVLMGITGALAAAPGSVDEELV